MCQKTVEIKQVSHVKNDWKRAISLYIYIYTDKNKEIDGTLERREINTNNKVTKINKADS